MTSAQGNISLVPSRGGNAAGFGSTAGGITDPLDGAAAPLAVGGSPRQLYFRLLSQGLGRALRDAHPAASQPAAEEPGEAQEPGKAKDARHDDACNGNAADARRFLQRQIDLTRDHRVPLDLQADFLTQADWVDRQAAEVGRRYASYRRERAAGAPRRYFGCRGHALHFLRGVAPTKLVDGAWLYGLVAQWRDGRFAELIQIYLEELGEGAPEQNHVAIYRRLLAELGCGNWQSLSDEHFVQGAIQLALAADAHRLVPEIIGYNLGYEQLPLHLLISAHELVEVGVDPYYFTLHVTVDNASSGHARLALRALHAVLPSVEDKPAFLRRVAAGWRLNEAGASTLSVIDGFDLDTEVRRILVAKSDLGRLMHADRCRIAGRTVNDWLRTPAQTEAFLDELVRSGWIRRGRPAAESRFWRLLDQQGGPMFGVFDGYERQVLHDWITGETEPVQLRNGRATRQPSMGRDRTGWPVRTCAGAPPGDRTRSDGTEPIERALQLRLMAQPDDASRLDMLAPLLAPHHHFTPSGLAATRLFAALFPGASP